MKKAYIMRGIPGSGKTTKANKLIGDTGVIHSVDEYFMKNGTYVFDFERWQEYKDKNFQAFCESLKKGIDIVICDRVNSTRLECEKFARAAEDAGYETEIITLPHLTAQEAAKRSTHNVPAEAIQKVLDQWED
jgi:hypothetical protein